MRTVLKVIITACALWSASVGFGQDLRGAKHTSPFGYIFKLTQDEAKLFYEQDSLNLEGIVTSRIPIDSAKNPTGFNAKSYLSDKPFGHYVFIYAQKLQLEVNVIQHCPLSIELHNLQKKTMFSLFDLKHKRVKDADITFLEENKTISFEQNLNCYSFLPDTNQGILRVKSDGQLAYYQINSRETSPYYGGYNRTRIVGSRYRSTLKQWWRTFLRRPYILPLWPYYKTKRLYRRIFKNYGIQGYLATDKPMYRPLDTLNIKVFAQTMKPKFARRPVRIRIGDAPYYSDEEDPNYLIDTIIKGVRPGNYQLKVPVSDMFRVDQQYYISAQPRNGNGEITNSFRVEDYQLDESSYTVNTSKQSYQYPQDIELELEGKDVNGQYILDGRARIIITPQIVNLYEKQVFVPDTLVDTTIYLNPAEKTTFTLKNGFIPEISASLNTKVIFNNSNNELHEQFRSVSYEGNKNRLEYKIEENGLITFQYVEDSVVIPREDIRLEILSMQQSRNYYNPQGNTKVIKQVKLPYTVEDVSQNLLYRFFIDGEKKEYRTRKILGPNRFNFSYDRSRDSLKLFFSNPGNSDVRFFLYDEEHEIVQQGFVSEDFKEIKIRCKPLQIHYLAYQCRWLDEEVNRSLKIYHNPNKLIVKTNIPGQIAPGHEQKVKIEVWDDQLQPVENADITAFAYNNQIKRDNVPSVSLRSRSIPNGPKNVTYRVQSLDLKKHWNWLSSFWQEYLHLDTMLFYQAVFPGDKPFVYYDDDLLDCGSQFSVYLFRNGTSIPIHVVYLDSVPVYFSGRTPQKGSPIYSFDAAPGRHRVGIRTKYGYYEVKDVEIKANTKLELALDVTYPANFERIEKRPDILTTDEVAYLAKYFMRVKWYRSPTPLKGKTDKYGDYYKLDKSYEILEHYKVNNVVYNSYLYDRQEEMVVGPFNPGELLWPIYGDVNAVNFDPSMDYTIREKRQEKTGKSTVLDWLSTQTKLQKQVGNSYFGGYRYLDCPNKPEYTSFKIKTKIKTDGPNGQGPISYYNYYYYRNPKPDSIPKGNLLIKSTLSKSKGVGQIIRFRNANFVMNYTVYLNGFGISNQNHIPEGVYTIDWISDSGLFVMDKIEIKSNQTNCLELNDSILGRRIIDSDKLTFRKYYEIHQPLQNWFDDGLDVVLSTNARNQSRYLYDYRRSFTSQPRVSNGGSITGKVRSPRTGKFLKGAVVMLMLNDNPVRGVLSDAKGNFTINGLEPGNYELEVVAQNFYPTYKCDIDVKGHSKVAVGAITLIESNGVVQVINTLDHFHRSASYPYLRHSEPLIRDRGTSGGAIAGDDLKKMGTRSVNNVVNLVGGTVSSDDGQIPLITGARGNTAVYVNGVTRIEQANLKSTASALPGAMKLPVSSANYGQEPIVEEVSNSKNPKGEIENTSAKAKKRIRTNFTDAAFWQPGLQTNKDGVATFQVKYPDNLTSWNTNVLVVGANQRSRQLRFITKSVQDFVAELRTPRFLLEGDSAYVISKVLNYSGRSMRIKHRFQSKSLADTTIGYSIFNEHLVVPKDSLDSLQFEYTAENDAQGFDGERRKIPVLPVGTEEAMGQFYYIQSDSVIIFKPNENAGSVQVHVQANLYKELLESIKYLEYYPYGCNEQLSSKLRALLMKKRILKFFGERFSIRDRIVIRKIIKKLVQRQNFQGGWGWWPDGDPNPWMSSYVYRTLKKASAAGYKVKLKDKEAIAYLNSIQDFKYVEEMIASHTYNSDYLTKYLYSDYLFETDYGRVLRTYVYQQQGKAYEEDLKEVFTRSKRTALGGLYWGNNGYGWNSNAIHVTTLVYKILKKAGGYEKELQQINQFFFEARKNNHWTNTRQTMEVLELLIDNMEAEGEKMKGTKEAKIKVNGIPIAELPFDKSYFKSNTDSLRMEIKTTKPLYVNFSQKFWNSDPVDSSSIFEIHSTIINKQGGVVKEFKKGESYRMKIEVDCKKSAEYVMVEVPIPAGCSYGAKQRRGYGSVYEVHRSYFKHKTSIFCQDMGVGKHTFYVNLEPRFKGAYTLNPTKVELMYFPQYFGRNAIRRVRIN